VDHILREALLLRDSDRLTVQAVASAWLGARWRARALGTRDAERDLVRDLVAATRGRKADAAHLALRALATIAHGDWGQAVADALRSAPSVGVPGWAVDPETREPESPVAALRWSDPWGSNVVHLLRFTDPVEHSLFAFETTVGGRFVEVLEVGTQDAEPEPVVGDMTAVEVSPEDALADLADALWHTDMYWPPQDDPDYALTRALAHWRTRDHHREVDRLPLSDDDRRRLIDDFLTASDLDDDDTVEILADTFIDFGDGYLHGGVLAWSPGEVEVFMLDWVHRKVVLDPECGQALPSVLAAWVAFALGRRGLLPQHIAPVVERVVDLEQQYVELASGGSAGPAQEIAARLLAAGIDIGDKDAVDRVIGAYNAEQVARRAFES
jgi:hypothetical protein